MNFVYGLLDDSTSLIILSWKNVLGTISSEPIYLNLFFFFGERINSILFFSLYVFITFILNFIFTYRFFGIFSQSNYLKILVTLIFCLSPYFLVKSQVHINLIPVWTLIAYITYLLKVYLKKEFTNKNFFTMAVFLSFVILYSNYLGYMGIIFTFSYFAFLIWENKFSEFKSFIFKIFLFSLTLFLVLLVFNYKYIESNYLNKIANTVVYETDQSKYKLERNYEDFVLFSASPLQYLFPPISNPETGFILLKISELVTNHGGEINFVYNEHATIFLGWVNLLMFAFSVFIIFVRKYNVKNLKLYKLSIFIILVFVVFSLSPQYSSASYLSYLVFPMFRSIARLSIIVLLFLLVFVLFSYEYLSLKIKPNNLSIIFILSLFFLSIKEFYTPINISYFHKTPDVFDYATKNFQEIDKFAVLPFGKNPVAVFWSKDFKGQFFDIPTEVKRILKTKDYPNYSDELFLYCQNISQIENLDYLIVFENHLKKEELEFIERNFELIYNSQKSNEETFHNYNFYRLINVGDTLSNNGRIYKFDNKIDCKN